MKSGIMDAMDAKARPTLMIMIGHGGPPPRPKTPQQELEAVRSASPKPKDPIPGEEDDDEDPEEDDDEDATRSHASPEEMDNKRIVVEAMQALQGKHDQPELALDEYVATYGQKDLDELRKMVTGKEPIRAASGHLVEGPGRGMEDRVPARVGDQPLLLSDGEYVIPADVVSGLGDGSTAGGVRVIEAMMARVRRGRTGSTRQPAGLELARVLPR